MSFRNYDWAWKQSGLGFRDKLVLLCLVKHERNGECWPGVNTLADLTGMDRRTVQRALGVLGEYGLITTHYDHRGIRRFTLKLGVTVRRPPHDTQTRGGVPLSEKGASQSHPNKESEYVSEKVIEAANPSGQLPPFGNLSEGAEKKEIKNMNLSVSAREGYEMDVDSIRMDFDTGLSDDDILAMAKFDRDGVLTSATASKIFRVLVAKYHPGPTLPPATQKQVGQLRHFAKRAHPRATKALFRCITEWGPFTTFAEKNFGAFKSPKRPNIEYLLRYAEAASAWVPYSEQADATVERLLRQQKVAKAEAQHKLTNPISKEETPVSDDDAPMTAEDLRDL